VYKLIKVIKKLTQSTVQNYESCN